MCGVLAGGWHKSWGPLVAVVETCTCQLPSTFQGLVVRADDEGLFDDRHRFWGCDHNFAAGFRIGEVQDGSVDVLFFIQKHLSTLLFN